MSLNTLIDYISNSQITSELIKKISKNNELNIVGSSRYAKSVIARSATTLKNRKLFLLLSAPFSGFIISEFKKILEKNKYIK